MRERIDSSVQRLLEPEEMYKVFDLNAHMMQRCIDDYLGSRDDAPSTSINRLYVHRGIFPPQRIKDEALIEQNYLSSYSLATTVAGMFAQTFSTGSEGSGSPTLIGAPLPAVMSRIVAFAPFISQMSVGQLELIAAPPLVPFPLNYYGAHGFALHFDEYQYDRLAAPSSVRVPVTF